jgi:hypothetical protein
VKKQVHIVMPNGQQKTAEKFGAMNIERVL